MDFTQSLVDHVLSGYSIISVVCRDEARADDAICKAADQLSEIRKKRYWPLGWDPFIGLRNLYNQVKVLDDKVAPGLHEARTAGDLLKTLMVPNALGEEDDNCLLVLKDFQNIQDAKDVRRVLRYLYANGHLNSPKSQRTVILLQPNHSRHVDLEDIATELSFPLPDTEKLLEAVRQLDHNNEASPDTHHTWAKALQGLTDSEATNCLFLAARYNRGINDGLLDHIQSIKSTIFERNPALKYTSAEQIADAQDISGYDSFFEYIDCRSLAYTREAAELGLDLPNGVAIFGVPGTGKSVVGGIISKRLRLPLVEFKFSALFRSLLGQSEQQLRDVIDKVTSMDGCVLLIDEVDKALGNPGSQDGAGGAGSEVATRLLGELLTWMAKKRDRTFVVFTLNRVANVPPELLRRGRVDALYYVDLPTDDERRAILEIHLRKRGIPLNTYSAQDWERFVSLSAEMVGAELEEAVTAARFSAFQDFYIRSRQERLRACPDPDKPVLAAEIEKFGADAKSRAFSLDDAALRLAGRAVPTADQICAAIRLDYSSRVAAVRADDIKAIQDFGKKHGRPVRRPAKADPGAGPPRRRARSTQFE